MKKRGMESIKRKSFRGSVKANGKGDEWRALAVELALLARVLMLGGLVWVGGSSKQRQ